MICSQKVVDGVLVIRHQMKRDSRRTPGLVRLLLAPASQECSIDSQKLRPPQAKPHILAIDFNVYDMWPTQTGQSRRLLSRARERSMGTTISSPQASQM